MNARREWAVILARGASKRMGRPKGLCRLSGHSRCFLQRVLDLYRSRRTPAVVVTTTALQDVYGAVLGDDQPRRWLTGAAGGDTAMSVWIALADLASEASHLWLHPVDLPLVQSSTLEQLARVSERRPEAVIVPVCGGVPGHPVILPVHPFARMKATAARGRMRDVLLAGARGDPPRRAPIVNVKVTDKGVTRDFDDVGDEIQTEASEVQRERKSNGQSEKSSGE